MKNRKRIKLYLDIDGVLLTKRNPRPKNFSKRLIQFAVENFDCYWLTTHCKGDTGTAIKYLKPYFPEVYLRMLSKIKPTNWDALKTDAIDFESAFVWIDDMMPFEAEQKVLSEKNKGNFILVSESTGLLFVIEKLKDVLVKYRR